MRAMAVAVVVMGNKEQLEELTAAVTELLVTALVWSGLQEARARYVAEDRAANIVMGCIDLSEHDAWLGVMAAMLVMTEPHGGLAPLPACAGILADGITRLLRSQNPTREVPRLSHGYVDAIIPREAA